MSKNSPFDLKSYLDERRGIINRSLGAILSTCSPDRELTRAMDHSLMAGGKRLRPILTLAAAETLGGDHRTALAPACAIEMIHTYSLIHDDLPAMDDDDLRRGRPTAHVKFSEATAVLAGDGLLTHAFQVLSRPEKYFSIHPGPEILLELVAVISDAAGINGMIQGQMMDILAQGDKDAPRKMDLDHIKEIHRRKTGRMIMASVDAGVLCGDHDPEDRKALALYADRIGLAFQVVDDILNVEGDPAVMGKAAGSDAESHKMTFPAQLGLEGSRRYARELILEAEAALDQFGDRAMALRAVAGYIMDRKK